MQLNPVHPYVTIPKVIPVLLETGIQLFKYLKAWIPAKSMRE